MAFTTLKIENVTFSKSVLLHNASLEKHHDNYAYCQVRF